MKKINLKVAVIAVSCIFYLSAFVSIDGNDEKSTKVYGPDDWSDYKSWYKITTEPNTGDPTGFLQGKHKGTAAYRDIFINEVGKEAYLNKQFPLPDGTIIVKEAFKNKKAYDAQKGPELTIMVKSSAEGSEDTGNYIWYMGGNGKLKGTGMDTKWGEFCGSCHAFGQAADYTFMSTLGDE